MRLDALVLAGGAGRRFGGGKLTAPWGDGLLIDGALAAAFAAPARTVTVVTGAYPAEVAEAAMAFAERIGEADRLRLVHAADHEDGMSASLRAGVTALHTDSEGVFVFLGDMPRTPPGVAGLLAAALRTGVEAVAPMFEGRRGHPVLMTAEMYPDLLKLTGDRGAGSLLAALDEELAILAVADDGVLFDVDTTDYIDRSI